MQVSGFLEAFKINLFFYLYNSIKMFPVKVTTLIQDRTFLFQCLTPVRVNQNILKDFEARVLNYLQVSYPCHQYNLYVEHNLDILSYVVILDINDITEKSIKDVREITI